MNIIEKIAHLFATSDLLGLDQLLREIDGYLITEREANTYKTIIECHITALDEIADLSMEIPAYVR